MTKIEPAVALFLNKLIKKEIDEKSCRCVSYAYIVAACEAQQSPIEVVYHHADAVQALPPGTDGAGHHGRGFG
jgi:hypothetical protein